MPKVSICIPAYNQIEYLKLGLESILSQTYQDYEVIVTDDSSNDNVENLVSKYNFDGRLFYYKNSPALGSPGNWNFCISKASGEYIKILHHDDWFNYDYSLSHYVRLLDNDPDVDFAFSASKVVIAGEEPWINELTPRQLSIIMKNPLTLLSGNLIGAPSAVIFRNKGLLFDANLKWFVDIEYYLRQWKSNKQIAYGPESLIVTFGAEGRVTDECNNNKEIEVFEYFYILNLIDIDKKTFTTKQIKSALIYSVDICKKYNIKSIAEIRDCGYDGGINNYVKQYLFLNKLSTLLSKAYSFLIKKI